MDSEVSTKPQVKNRASVKPLNASRKSGQNETSRNVGVPLYLHSGSNTKNDKSHNNAQSNVMSPSMDVGNSVTESDVQSDPIRTGRNNTGNLPDAIRNKMENVFESDFSSVNIRENSQSAKNLDAIAYTQGEQIHFAPGYEPYSSQGQEILGHELSHVVQQRSGAVGTTHQELGFNVNSDSRLENEADHAAKKAANGKKAGLIQNGFQSLNNTSVQKQSAPIQLLREPIPASAFILDINATADYVLEWLVYTAFSASRQASDVNWRRIFYPTIEAQIRGKQLGSISHDWTDYTGINYDWEVSISFYMDNVIPTGRRDSRSITTSQGGAASPSLGSSQSQASSSGASVGGEANVEGGKVTGGVEMGETHTRGQSQGTGGGMTGGQAQSSTETVNRYIGVLHASIDVTATAGYSNWDIINPVKWGAHLHGKQHAENSPNIGTITFDRPEF